MIMQVYAHLDDLKENTKFKLDQMVRIDDFLRQFYDKIKIYDRFIDIYFNVF